MVKETRILIDVSDIRRVTLQCEDCSTEIGYLPKNGTDVPVSCPHCSTDWNANGEIAKVKRLIGELAALQKYVRVRVRMDVEESNGQ